MRILIAEDDQISRTLLSRTLEKNGYDVLAACNGAEAWEILQKEEIYLVITDWMMPEMDGIELCRKIRETRFPRYIYTVILTAKNAQGDLVEGMGAGADDFLVKPFKTDELFARIKAGERILKLEKDLEDRNKKLIEANKELGNAYSVIKKDLESAANIQKSLLPGTSLDIYNVHFDWMFLPCSFVAGDIFNYFQLDEYHVGFYLLDVVGHGASAAMLSFALSRIIIPTDLQDNILKNKIPESPHYEIKSPAMVLDDLNRRFQADDEVMQYFTIIYGVIDTRNHRTLLSQAGHPSPILLQPGEKSRLLGTGGFPIGIVPDPGYEEFEVYLKKDSRLILYSDGIPECLNRAKEQYSLDRFIGLLERNQDIPINEVTQEIEKELSIWKEGDEFKDDVTLLAIETV